MATAITCTPLVRLFARHGIPQRLVQQKLLKHCRSFYQFTSTNLTDKSRRNLNVGLKQNVIPLKFSVLLSHRCLSTCVTSQNESEIVVEKGDNKMVLPYIWLRDHCRCDVCYNHTTFQKNTDAYTLNAGTISPKKVNLTEDGSLLKIEWSDSHQSEYSTDWLTENSYSTKSKSKGSFFLWDKKSMTAEKLPMVPYEAYKDGSQEGIKQTFRNLLKYGFSIIDGVDATIKETQFAVEQLTFVQETIFGQMWSFTSDQSRSDTAYTNLALGAHTDTTYCYQPLGIQVFHCIWHDGTGGDTLLVDGFHAAEQFRRDHPEDFEFLTRAVVPHEYKEMDVNHLLSHGTILRTHPGSGELMYIRYNPYDMAPLDTIAPVDIPRFYAAYDKLSSYIKQPAGEFWLKLHPEMVLLVNNWRVLHGRSGFTGRRVVCGCYLPRDDWMNKARTLGLV